MIYISSDTSVWIDFATIERIDIPFRLPYTYIMNKDAIENEVLSPPGLGKQLVTCGLRAVEITIDEFILAEEFGSVYRKLSTYDRIALAIAKCRQIALLTGDKALRKAANQEKVTVIGTLGILDQLRNQRMITEGELRICLRSLLENNGGAVRLPEDELRTRLESLPKEDECD